MKVEGLRGSIYQRGGVWWVKYYQHGRPIRESSGSAAQRDAERLLLKRAAAVEEGRTIVPQVNRCKVDKLFELVVTDYRIKKRKSLRDVLGKVSNHLKPAFGGWKAVEVSSARLTKFIEQRQAAGATAGEINRELAIMRRAFRLGHRAKLVDQIPHFEMLTEDNARQGYFERAEFEAVISHLPPELTTPVRFSYVTGWRIHSEVLKLQWRQVDFAARTVRLEPGSTKNKQGRIFKFTTELEEVLRLQLTATRTVEREREIVCPWVFHRRGKPIRTFYGAWRSACLKAGLGKRDPRTKRIAAERIVHDLRRTAVRNLVRAGVPERVAMEMTGHKTRAVFERYNIVSESDHDHAIQRYNARLEAERAGLTDGHNPGTVAAIPTAASR